MVPRLAPDGKGGMAVVWQAFRARKDPAPNAPVPRPFANIMMKALEGEQWGANVRVTDHAANDWEPAIAFDASGNAWVAWDTYTKGNYDVMLSRVSGGKAAAAMVVAESARFEARATVAVDTSGRVWVAYEAGAPGWGKDQGYIVRSAPKGVVLGGVREPRIRCYDNGTCPGAIRHSQSTNRQRLQHLPAPCLQRRSRVSVCRRQNALQPGSAAARQSRLLGVPRVASRRRGLERGKGVGRFARPVPQRA